MEIFKSKRFWSAVLGLAVMVLGAFVPEVQENAETIVPAVLVLIGILIGGYSIEDAVEAYNKRNEE